MHHLSTAFVLDVKSPDQSHTGLEAVSSLVLYPSVLLFVIMLSVASDRKLESNWLKQKTRRKESPQQNPATTEKSMH